MNVRVGFSAVSLLSNALAAALLTPLLLAAGFVLMVESVATGRIFHAIVLVDWMLPVDPSWGAPLLIATALVLLGLLLFACLRVAWLFPSLLILLGGLAEAYILVVVGLGENGDPAIPALGAAGIAVSALHIWRTRPTVPSSRRSG